MSTDKVEKRANGKIVWSQFTYKTVEERDGGGSMMKPWIRSRKHCSLMHQHKNGRQWALRPGTHISECRKNYLWWGCGNGPESPPCKCICILSMVWRIEENQTQLKPTPMHTWWQDSALLLMAHLVWGFGWTTPTPDVHAAWPTYYVICPLSIAPIRVRVWMGFSWNNRAFHGWLILTLGYCIKLCSFWK